MEKNGDKEMKKGLKSILLTVQLLSVISVVGGFMSMLLILLTRSKSNFTGSEVYYDKMNLAFFNTIVLNGVIVLLVTVFLMNAVTEWRFRNCPFMIMDAIILFIVFLLSYVKVGMAIGGMASVADAGYHMNEMAGQYMKFWNQAEISLIIILVMLTAAIFIAIYQPFGRKEKEDYKHRKIVLLMITIVVVAGVALFIKSESTLVKTRNLPIQDMDASNLPDGVYEGETAYSQSVIHVMVTVKDGKITKIEDPATDISTHTKYARGVFGKIIEKQNPNVDAISGATTTSKAYMKAVENALKK